MKQINLYTFNDYRAYLKAYYDYQKSISAHGFSYRIFSERAGLRSPNYYKMVMEGTRNLSSKMIQRFADALKLEGKKRLFFEALVQFNQAKQPDDQNFYFQKMLSFKEYREAAPLTAEQYEYLSRWYYVAIREMIALHDFDANPKVIAYRLQPAISEAQAREALLLLEKLKLIKKNKKGLYTQCDSQIKTEPNIAAITAYNYHRQMIRLGLDSLMLDPTQREVSGMTMSIASPLFPELKKKLFQFLLDIQHWLGEQKQPDDQLYQLNFQLLPLTQLAKGV